MIFVKKFYIKDKKLFTEDEGLHFIIGRADVSLRHALARNHDIFLTTGTNNDI